MGTTEPTAEKTQDLSSRNEKEDDFDDISPVTRTSSKDSPDEKQIVDSKTHNAQESQEEKDLEAVDQPSNDDAHLVASEDYSVFTVGQKRSIILAGSFIGWFSPMSGSIYYPALDQVCYLRRTDCDSNSILMLRFRLRTI